MRLVKGHGTENDFLVLPDLDGAITLTAAEVRRLCDRRAGVGADGVLRVVRSENDPDAKEMAGEAEFFMDYRNADGSVAEMCGNGIRVFLTYLIGAGLVKQDAAVATRGGIRRARALGDGNVTVHMGPPRFLADRPVATAAFRHSDGQLDEVTRPGVALALPNPHVVVALDEAAGGAELLASLDLQRAPRVEPPLPDGQNVEFVVRRGERTVAMRVHERGVGETRSCGTGVCAAAVATARADGTDGDGRPWTVLAPGGRCEVVWRPDGEVLLTGPAVLVADVDVRDGLWEDGRCGPQ